MATVNPQAVIDTESYQVTRTVHIRATPERVWAALTRDDLVAQWFGSTADLPDLRVGGMGTFGFEGYGEFPVRIEEYDEPVVFAFTWGSPGEPLRDGQLHPGPVHARRRRGRHPADGRRVGLRPARPGPAGRDGGQPRRLDRRARRAGRPPRGRGMSSATLAPVFAALADDTRWQILARSSGDPTCRRPRWPPACR